MGRTKITDSDFQLNEYVGKRIKLYRKYKGLRIKDLADKIGVTLNQVNLYEKGRGDIRASMLAKIANVLQVSMAELFPESQGYEQVPEGLVLILTEIRKRNLNPKDVLELIQQSEF